MKRFFKCLGAVSCAGLAWWSAGPEVLVSSRARGLKDIGLEIQYAGRPFSGVLYGFYKNRRPKQLTFVWRGRRIGTEYSWHSNGQIAFVAPYREGRRHGVWKQWYADGGVRAYRTYVDGAIDGEYWTWHGNGVVSDYRVFDKGKLLVFKSFISDGKPYYNYVYHQGKRVGLQGGDFCKTKRL